MIPLDRPEVDPATVALAARRLAGLLPPLTPPAVEAGWSGAAARAADGSVTATLAAYGQARLALTETADALAATAAALDAALTTFAAADRLAAAEGVAAGPVGDPVLVATLGRLRADAAGQLVEADARCARRLQALLADHVLVLPPLVGPVSPEQAELAVLRAGGWSSVPTALVGPLTALAPELATALPGAPATAREIAARLALADHAELLAPQADGTARQYLLAGPGGALAEVWGDLAHARTVVVIVPGTETSAGNFGSAQQQGDATIDELRRQAGPDVAVISWDGSPEPPSFTSAALTSWAEKAAPLLRDFLVALPVASGARVTLVGHSYGAVVAGEAVREGARPDALIGVAPAGFGPGVRSGRDLHGVPTYVLEKSDDPIKDERAIKEAIRQQLDDPLLAGWNAARLLPFLHDLPHAPVTKGLGDLLEGAAGLVGIGDLGTDPRCMPGTTELASGNDSYDWVPVSANVPVHGSYFLPGSTALRQIGAVGAGKPVTEAPPDTCRKR